MIYEALSFLSDEMNEYFRNKLKIKEDKIVLSAVVDQSGAIAIQGENKVAITLVNIERETITTNTGGMAAAGRGIENRSLPMQINLYLLFSAYFSNTNYPEALRFISYVIAYFQSRSVFTRASAPALDVRIDKLILEMASLSPEQLNNTWACLGAKYMPSVVYKMRMLSFDESIIREYRPSVTGIGGDLTNS